MISLRALCVSVVNSSLFAVIETGFPLARE